MSVCKNCNGKGYVETHRSGFTHYETDVGEECPGYHFARTPCSCTAGANAELAAIRLAFPEGHLARTEGSIADGVREIVVERDKDYAEMRRFQELYIRVAHERDKAQESLAQQLALYDWRPIAEIHEDHGQCVLIHLIDDPSYTEVGSILDEGFDEGDWTHFALVPRLSTERASELLAALGTPERKL